MCEVLMKYPFLPLAALLSHKKRIKVKLRFTKWKKAPGLKVVADRSWIERHPLKIWEQDHKRMELEMANRRVRVMGLRSRLEVLDGKMVISRQQLHVVNCAHYSALTELNKGYSPMSLKVLKMERTMPTYDLYGRCRSIHSELQGEYEATLEQYQYLIRNLDVPIYLAKLPVR
jgi:hypothetical protein